MRKQSIQRALLDIAASFVYSQDPSRKDRAMVKSWLCHKGHLRVHNLRRLLRDVS